MFRVLVSKTWAHQHSLTGLYRTKSFLNTQLEENIKIKLISEIRVLLRVNPISIFVVLYQIKWTE